MCEILRSSLPCRYGLRSGGGGGDNRSLANGGGGAKGGTTSTALSVGEAAAKSNQARVQVGTTHVRRDFVRTQASQAEKFRIDTKFFIGVCLSFILALILPFYICFEDGSSNINHSTFI